MARNPSVSITSVDGSLLPAINTADDVVLKVGAATAGRFNVPQRASSVNGVCALHDFGPLVRSGAHQVDYGSPCYLMRCRASTAGTVGSVTRTPSTTMPASAGSLAISLTSYTPHASAAAGAALSLTSGWSAPLAPLPLSVSVGAGAGTFTATVTYVDEAGDTQTETLSWTGSAATRTTTGYVAQVLSYTTSGDPGGTTTFAQTFGSVGDRLDVVAVVTRGGQVGVDGATLAQYTLSYDGGITASRPRTLDSTGIAELTTYAGGLTAQATGITATFAAGTNTADSYGAVRVAGATSNGDVVYDLRVADATVVHTVPALNSQTLSVSVSTHQVTVSSATDASGLKAHFTFGGDWDTVFEVDFNGTAGNAVTMTSVADGTGTGSVTVSTNAVTVHFEDGVTTVGDIESLFGGAGVSIALGHVKVKTAGTGATTLDSGDVHGAAAMTGGTNAAASSTATQAAAAVNASASAALVSATAAGTGAGILAAASSAGGANGGGEWTALIEGVRVRVLRGAAGASLRVSATTAGLVRSLEITPATDSYGVQTSTANEIAAAVAADAVASLWASMDPSGTGAGIIGALGEWFNLPVSLTTGDKFTFTTTPPTWTAADLQESLTALLSNDTWLSYFSILHVVGAADATSDAILDTFITNAKARRKKYNLIAVVEGTYMGSTAEATWANALLTTFADRSSQYGVYAGEVNALNNAYGTVDRMPVATPYVARLSICPIGEQPSHVECDTLLGTQYALLGCLDRPGTGSTPLWQTDDTLVTLNESNIGTLRKHPGRSGIYVRQGLQHAAEGSDYTFVSRARIVGVANAIAYDQALRFLNGGFLLDPKTGQLAEAECQKLESVISGALRRKLVGNDQGRTHASSVQFVVTRGENMAQTNNISGNIYIVPKGIAETISITTQFTPAAR